MTKPLPQICGPVDHSAPWNCFCPPLQPCGKYLASHRFASRGEEPNSHTDDHQDAGISIPLATVVFTGEEKINSLIWDHVDVSHET